MRDNMYGDEPLDELVEFGDLRIRRDGPVTDLLAVIASAQVAQVAAASTPANGAWVSLGWLHAGGYVLRRTPVMCFRDDEPWILSGDGQCITPVALQVDSPGSTVTDSVTGYRVWHPGAVVIVDGEPTPERDIHEDDLYRDLAQRLGRDAGRGPSLRVVKGVGDE